MLCCCCCCFRLKKEKLIFLNNWLHSQSNTFISIRAIKRHETRMKVKFINRNLPMPGSCQSKPFDCQSLLVVPLLVLVLLDNDLCLLINSRVAFLLFVFVVADVEISMASSRSLHWGIVCIFKLNRARLAPTFGIRNVNKSRHSFINSIHHWADDDADDVGKDMFWTWRKNFTTTMIMSINEANDMHRKSMTKETTSDDGDDDACWLDYGG